MTNRCCCAPRERGDEIVALISHQLLERLALAYAARPNILFKNEMSPGTSYRLVTLQHRRSEHRLRRWQCIVRADVRPRPTRRSHSRIFENSASAGLFGEAVQDPVFGRWLLAPGRQRRSIERSLKSTKPCENWIRIPVLTEPWYPRHRTYSGEDRFQLLLLPEFGTTMLGRTT